MADRQQNIRIKFTKDTTALTDIKQLAQQAQQATDNLKQSASNLGKGFQDGARKSVQSLESMNLQLARLKAQITLTTDPKQINRLTDQYKQLKTQLDATTKAYFQQGQAIKNVEQQTKSLGITFGTLTSAVRLFIAAGVVRETVTMALEMAKLAGNVEGVKRAFDKLPGSIVLLDQLRHATQGTVTDFELMQRSLQAKNFRIPLEQLGKLFEFATVRAQQTGQSVDYLINSIVFGLGFQSIRRLDNVGISAAELRDVMKELGVSLNEAFNIVVNREIEKMGGLVKTSATEVDILNKNLQDLKTSLSQRFTNSGWIQFLSESLRALSTLAKSIPEIKLTTFISLNGINFLREWNKNVEETVRSERNLKTATQELKDIQDGLGESARQQVDSLIQETIARRTSIREYTGYIEKKKAEIQLNDLVNKSNSETRVQYLRTRDELNAQLKGLQNRLEIDKIVVGELTKMLLALTKGGTPNELGLIEAKLKEIEDVADGIKTAKSRQEIHDLSNDLARLKGELADLEAFGTTKQFLKVNGELKLVPVIDPKGLEKTIAAEPIFKKEVSIPIGFNYQGKPLFDPGHTRAATDQIQKDVNTMIDNINASIKGIAIPLSSRESNRKKGFQVELDDFDKFQLALKEHQKEFADLAFQSSSDLITAQIDAEAQGMDIRIKKTKDFYDEQLLLAGDNEKAKKLLRLKEERDIQELTRKRADAEQKAAKASIVVNTALGIIKAIATAVTIYDGLVQAAYVAGEGVAQYAVANSARYYAKGKVNIDGPGTSTSDSIRANLSKGESVIAASPTKKSLKLLEGINAGKIDDRILDRLHITKQGIVQKPYDDSGVINAIKSQRPQDTIKIASDIYEVKKDSDDFITRLRRKSLSK